ncbi:MAG TPA: YhdP family protein [Burkholderiaceae bacterium]|nr:YhdP family protein [Burkholderiaceae bacterium]
MSSATTAPPFVDRRRHRWLRRAWRWAFGTLFVAWTLLLTAWLTLQWGILPRVGQWRPQIEARASVALGVPVSIGAIRVRSGGWMPALELDDVVLHDAQRREALRLPKVQAALSARSFVGLQVRFEQLLIDGATLEVRRDADGRLFVGGLAVDGGVAAAGQDNAAADWLLAQHEFVVRGARVRWIDELRAPGEPLELGGVDLVIRNGIVSHDLRLDATPPAAWGDRFTLAGRFTQPLWAARGDWRRWSGTAHAWLPRARAGLLREPGVGLPFAVEGGEGALRAWVEWQGGEWRDATADVALADVTLRFAQIAEPLRVTRLEGRLQAQNDERRLRLAAEGLRFASDGVTWPATRGEVTLRHAAPSGGAASAGRFAGGEVVLDRIDLAALAQLAARLPLGEPLRKLLAELAPSGQVSALAARWDGSLDDPKRYQAKGSVTGLSIAAARAQEAGTVGRPGWRNATFDFDASETGGRARLVLDRGALVLPGVFEQPEIAFDSFGTRLAWKIDGPPLAPKAAEVTLSETRFANADTQGELGTATWRTGPGAGFGKGARFPGQIDLAGQLSRGRAQAVARYLPLGLPEPVRRYVERAVTGGNVAAASFKLRGDLWDFPFATAAPAPAAKDGGGVFHIAARVDDVGLAYVPSEPGWSSPWPAFTRVSGELVFDRLSMEIRNAQARLWGVELSKVNGSIRDLERPLLRVEGQVRGPAADLLRYVNTTPVGEWTSRALAGAGASGAAELKLALELPLDALDRSKVQGALVLPGNDLRLASDTPLLAGAKARVAFTESGVQIAGASARVLGGDATFDGGTQTDGTQRFTAQGVASAEGLRRASELGALARLAQSASGQTPYRLALAFVRGRTELTLTSPLTGLALDLPAPLKKPAEAAWPLSVTTRLAADGSARDAVKLELGSIVQAQYERDLARDTPQVLRGSIAVNDSLPPLPARGVQALLALPVLDLDAWQVVGERLQAGSAGAADARALDDSYLPRTLALRAQSVISGGRRLTQVVVGVSQDGADGAWRGNVDADQLGGYVEYRAARGAANPGRVHARLARLALPPSEASSVENLLADSPVAVPALDIVIDDFELRGKKLGKLEIEAVNRGTEGGGARAAREWRLTRFVLTNPEAQLTGSGQWQPSANAPRMVMDFRLELADSGALLARLGFPGTLRAGKGRLAGQLQWAGSPLALHVPSLDGKVNLALEQGQFLKAGPGAGRLLSVLSLQSLPRRLALDFRDLFQEGFAFDNIVGDVAIDDGVAHTNNLRMRGVQAAVLMEGSADIDKETQQLRVIVVPEINAGTASLAYAAINPAVGLGTFLAQILLRRPLIAASTREFTVQGSWAEPKVERVERKPGDPVPDIDAVPAAASAPKAAS